MSQNYNTRKSETDLVVHLARANGANRRYQSNTLVAYTFISRLARIRIRIPMKSFKNVGFHERPER